MAQQMNIRDWILLTTLSILWGGSFFFTEIALEEVTPLVSAWGRVLGAALILLIIVRLTGKAIPKDFGVIRAFVLMGVLNNVVPFTLIMWGQTEITGSLASIFNATTPLFTIVLAQFLTKDEKINMHKVLGLMLGFLGVVVMVGVQALNGLSGAFLAQIAILIAAISYGLAAIWGRRFKDIDPMVTATGQVTSSAIIMTPIALFFGFPNGYVIPSIQSLGAIFALALLCTVIAYVLYFKILTTSGATNLMLVTFLIPASAIALGSVLLGERLEVNQLIGMGFILVGLLVIDGRLIPRNRRKLRMR